jgi:hypothetical protein
MGGNNPALCQNAKGEVTMKEYETKYLERLKSTVFSEADKYFKSALPTLKRLHAKGLVVRGDLDGNEYAPDEQVDEDCFWTLKEK